MSAALDRGGWTVLVGPGGVGKTRLAEQVLADRPAFVSVDLSDVFDADALVATVGAALGVPDPDAERVAVALAARDSRGLLLDALDGLDDEALRVLSEWRRTAPALPLLATSRRRLGLTGERVVELDTLPRAEAIALFVDRAAAAGFVPSTEDDGAIGELVDRLDGLPLALELAAGRVHALGPDGLMRRLEDGLEGLSTAAPDRADRDRSLTASIEASWRWLDPADQEALASVSLLVGAFDADDTPWLGRPGASSDRLGRLVDRSLIRVVRGATGRYRSYVGVAAYARAWASPALVEQVHDGLVERATALADRLGGPDDAGSLAGLARVGPSLLAAANATLASGQTERMVRLVLALDPWLQAKGPALVRRRWIANALARVSAGPTADALLARQVQTDPAAVSDEALERAQARASLAGDADLVRGLQLALGRSAWNRAALAEAEARYAVALEMAAEAPRDRLAARYALAGVRSARGATAAALRTFEEALADARDRGSALAEGLVLGSLGVSAHDADHPDAGRWLEQSVAVLTGLGDPRAAAFRVRLGDRALEAGRVAEAASQLDAALETLTAAGQLRLLGYAYGARAQVREAQGDRPGARDDLVRAEAMETRHGTRVVAGLIAAWRTRLESEAGDPEAAAAARARAKERLAGVDHPYTSVLRLCVAHAEPASAASVLEATEETASRSSEVRAARARLRIASARDVLEVGPGCSWFEAGGVRVDLTARHPIRRVLEALVVAPAALDVEALFRAGWPGETASVGAARDRVYHAVATLRRLGLGDRLTRGEAGWHLRGPVRASSGGVLGG